MYLNMITVKVRWWLEAFKVFLFWITISLNLESASHISADFGVIHMGVGSLEWLNMAEWTMVKMVDTTDITN